MSRAPRAVSAALLLMLAASPAAAQDFAAAAPAGPAGGPLALLEHGLPDSVRGVTLIAAGTRWLGVAELETRTLALGGGLGPLRLAAGVSQTGEPEIGWNAAALGAGVIHDGIGAGVRGIVRRDRHGDGRGGEATPAFELGGGTWIAAAPWLALWAASPRMASRGAAPIARRLELGAALAGAGLRGWLVHRVATTAAAEHDAGIVLALGPAEAWAAARDAPLRPRIGLCARAGVVGIAVEVEAHPALGETARLGLQLGARP